MESTQLPKDWRFTSNHPKDLIIGDVFKRELLAPNFMIFVVILYLFHIVSPRTSSKPRVTHIGCLQWKKSSINLSVTRFDTLFLGSMID